MSAAATNPIARCHVVAVPYPGRGHINPMMNLCKFLLSSSTNRNNNPQYFDIVITFVITEEWLGFIASDDKPPSIRFATIPNVLPSELVRAADMPSFVGATQTKMEEPFERLLDRLDAPPNVIIADTFLLWANSVGNRRNIPVASLWPMPAAAFSVFYHFDLLVQNGHFPFELSERGEERVDYIPGISSIRLADLPTIIASKDQRLLNLALRVFGTVSKASCLLFTSVYELEPGVINHFKSEFQFPVYTIGPAIPCLDIENSLSLTTSTDNNSYQKWLDSQPPNSVLYVSLGSFLSVTSAQMDEIAAGLECSGVKYLWVARANAMRLNEICSSGRGMVVSWCEQLKVLSHPAVGGFWTHCGWNSTMESIFAGLPMLTLPLLMDQVVVNKFVVEDWKIGWNTKKIEERKESLLGRGEIGDMVKKFMNLESKERREMTVRAREFQQLCCGAIAEGGSSHTNLNSFLDIIARN